jgi:uncharacterized protein (TIGR03067 family)
MRVLLLVGAMAGLAAGGERAADPLVGKWETVSVIRGDLPDDELRGAVREHTADGKYTITPAAGSKSPKVAGRYTVDATKTPPHIDMTPDTGKYKGQTLKGVYKLDGDALVIAFAEPGQPRPGDTEPKMNRVCATHRRAK